MTERVGYRIDGEADVSFDITDELSSMADITSELEVDYHFDGVRVEFAADDEGVTHQWLVLVNAVQRERLGLIA